jgi:glycine betaine/proline transport system ATP-binding protein
MAEKAGMADRLKVENLYKVFASSPEKAMAMLRTGATKDEVLAKTGAVVGLNDISFSVPSGAIYMIMGLSGSGKSTLARCINRLNQPTAGKILLDGQDLVALGDQGLRDVRRTRISMVFQHFALQPNRSVMENAEFGLKLRGVAKRERRQRAEEVLSIVGLAQWANHRPHELSGGMRQRVGLARALATDADVLIMDEAFSALDPLIRAEMQDELLRLQRALHKTILFITHDFQEALKLGNRIAILADGELVQEGAPQEIVTRPANGYVAAFTRDVDRARLFDARSAMEEIAPVTPAHANVLGGRAPGGCAFVVDEQARVVGLLDRGALGLVRDGAAPGALMSAEFMTVSCNTKLIEVARNFRPGHPMAVLDEAGRLIGTLEAEQILAGIASMPAAAPLRGEHHA